MTPKKEQTLYFYYIGVTPQKSILWQCSVTPIPFYDDASMSLWNEASCQSKSEPSNLQMKDQKCKMCWCSLFCNIQASPGKHKRCFCEEEGMMTQQRASSNNSWCCRDHFTSSQTMCYNCAPHPHAHTNNINISAANIMFCAVLKFFIFSTTLSILWWLGWCWCLSQLHMGEGRVHSQNEQPAHPQS